MTTNASPRPLANPVVEFSAALSALVADATPRVVAIRAAGAPPLTGTIWRPDVVIASEQAFPHVGEAEILPAAGASSPARVAGRDAGTNLVALRLDTPIDIDPPAASEPRHGGLALALSAGFAGPGISGPGFGGARARLGIVARIGPAWVSRAGGQIDRYIGLDLMIGTRGEGGPVFDAAGGLLGVATAEPGGRGLVIPAATIERVVGKLLEAGRIARGWLGLSLQPIALGDDPAAQSGHNRGLMVMQVAANGPAAVAGLLPGDIIVELDGTEIGRLRKIAQLLGDGSIGREVEIGLIRAGAPMRATVIIGERPVGRAAEHPVERRGE
jgi:S1-C subfamily serine protease